VKRGQEDFCAHPLIVPGALNFRDVGGYITEDSRRVRSQKLFRSGSLGRLDGEAQTALRSLEIANIFDLRTTKEREREPCAPSAIGAARYHFEAYEMNDTAILRRMTGTSRQAAEMRLAMIDYYAELPWLLLSQYRKLFRVLVDGELPILVSCTAGKDRTGVAIALVLYALGVHRDEIVQDYCLSEKLADYEEDVAKQLADGAMQRGMTLCLP